MYIPTAIHKKASNLGSYWATEIFFTFLKIREQYAADGNICTFTALSLAPWNTCKKRWNCDGNLAHIFGAIFNTEG